MQSHSAETTAAVLALASTLGLAPLPLQRPLSLPVAHLTPSVRAPPQPLPPRPPSASAAATKAAAAAVAAADANAAAVAAAAAAVAAPLLLTCPVGATQNASQSGVLTASALGGSASGVATPSLKGSLIAAKGGRAFPFVLPALPAPALPPGLAAAAAAGLAATGALAVEYAAAAAAAVSAVTETATGAAVPAAAHRFGAPATATNNLDSKTAAMATKVLPPPLALSTAAAAESEAATRALAPGLLSCPLRLSGGGGAGGWHHPLLLPLTAPLAANEDWRAGNDPAARCAPHVAGERLSGYVDFSASAPATSSGNKDKESVNATARNSQA